MKLSKRMRFVLAGCAIAASGGLGLAFAAMAPENDALQIATATIGLQQAVGIAESHIGGKAARADFERDKTGKLVFDVEVARGTAVMDVKVDAANGAVLSAVIDRADMDSNEDDD